MADGNRQQRYRQSSPPIGSWEHIYPHSHHGTPAHEFNGFNFGTPPLPMDSGVFTAIIQPRPTPPQLQPLIMPQWPSMLNSHSQSNFQPVYPQPVQPIQPVSIAQLQTPVSAISSRSIPTPRKTLTDTDRKLMCQYAEEHPNSKQTEIGAVFGVERSTVSKVLRQKDKYLLQDEGSKSPVKRVKGRSPDIERTLAVWAKNQVSLTCLHWYTCTDDHQEKKGFPLSDELIREKARAFASTSSSSETQQIMSANWIEKFKLKNNLMGARSRRSSLAPDDAEGNSTVASSAHTPSGTSPISPLGIVSGSPALHSAKSQDSLQNESPDEYLDHSSGTGPFHSQSGTSLSSIFAENAPSSFSPEALSPTSPFFTPDSGTAPSPFVPAAPLTARPLLPAVSTTNNHRPRSQTVPLLDHFTMTGTCSEASTPRYINMPVLDSPMEEAPDPIRSIDSAILLSQPPEMERPYTISPHLTMRPPPLPAHVLQQADQQQQRRPTTPSTSSSSLLTNTNTNTNTSTSAEDALRALEVVNSFIEQQPHGFLEFQEGVTIGRLMEKLKLQSRANSISL
ncbi:hypothetical protein LTR62_006302 [Meristemomyces frigidus]|uniref:HTH CENPB-type domain-containing protein n=1 Tax=Meristemomyces frigidus TaxID=1508187 RepID=A0AAN7TCN6_9PEZI|nr:hypothetical protein LTR62_006302 [Meristemomyces frigidus]